MEFCWLVLLVEVLWVQTESPNSIWGRELQLKIKHKLNMPWEVLDLIEMWLFQSLSLILPKSEIKLKRKGTIRCYWYPSITFHKLPFFTWVTLISLIWLSTMNLLHLIKIIMSFILHCSGMKHLIFLSAFYLQKASTEEQAEHNIWNTNTLTSSCLSH